MDGAGGLDARETARSCDEVVTKRPLNEPAPASCCCLAGAGGPLPCKPSGRRPPAAPTPRNDGPAQNLRQLLDKADSPPRQSTRRPPRRPAGPAHRPPPAPAAPRLPAPRRPPPPPPA